MGNQQVKPTANTALKEKGVKYKIYLRETRAVERSKSGRGKAQGEGVGVREADNKGRIGKTMFEQTLEAEDSEC